MIDGINDRPDDAAALVQVLRGSDSHVNLIPMNSVAHTPWQESSAQRIEEIAEQLRASGLSVTVRRNRGREAGAACGQLAAERAGVPQRRVAVWHAVASCLLLRVPQRCRDAVHRHHSHLQGRSPHLIRLAEVTPHERRTDCSEHSEC